VETVVAVNEARKREMAHRIIRAFGGVAGKTVAMLGLTFKPNTDDMREAPSLTIIPTLKGEGARIRAYDPEGAREASKSLDIQLCADAYEAISGADGVVILTEWNEFRALDLARMKSLLKRALMVDLRNIYRPQQMAEAGFEYFSVGRPWDPEKAT
jgi:UDPglucose 6-dehydrogenase